MFLRCRNEIKAIRATSYIRGISLSFIMFTTRISIFISIVAYVMFGNHITAEKVSEDTCFCGYNLDSHLPKGNRVDHPDI